MISSIMDKYITTPVTQSNTVSVPSPPPTSADNAQSTTKSSTSSTTTPSKSSSASLWDLTLQTTIVYGISTGLTYAIVQQIIHKSSKLYYTTNNNNNNNDQQEENNNNNKSYKTLQRIQNVIQITRNNIQEGTKPKLLWNVVKMSICNIWCTTLSLFQEDDEEEQNDDDNQNNNNDEKKAVLKEKKGNELVGVIPTITSSSSSNINTTNYPTIVPKDEKRSRSNSVLTQTSEEVSTEQTQQQQTQQENRYLEMLVHNVSHMDLVLCLGLPAKYATSSSNNKPSSSSSEKDKHKNNDNNNNNDDDHASTTTWNDGKKDVKIMLPTPRKTRNQTTTTTSSQQQQKQVIRNKEEENAHVLCRPRFSAFDLFSRRALSVFKKNCCHKEKEEDQTTLLVSSIMSFPRYDRADSIPRAPLVTPRLLSRQVLLPVGFNLLQLLLNQDNTEEKEEGEDDSSGDKTDLDLTSEDIQSLRIRGRDVPKIEGLVESGHFPSPRLLTTKSSGRLDNSSTTSSSLSPSPDSVTDDDVMTTTTTTTTTNTKLQIHMEAIFFPLLSSLMRKWSCQMKDKYGSSTTTTNNNNNRNNKKQIKKVLILVTGVGTPRNWTHSISGNSTEACAELMEIFINVLYPDVTVVRLHSEREIFRYDENITFANKELIPCIDAYRDAHARGGKYPDEYLEKGWATQTIPKPYSTNTFNPDWKQTFSVTLSFADGAPARTHAIQTILRSYRPTYMHFFQLKTFWHESKICDDDIEVHSFEEMETVPALEVNKTNDHVQMVVEEMKNFRQFFLNTLHDGARNDIRNFWLRKTKKPVLAVLLVKRPGGEGLVMYRGTNMEVSMPTGSLCAERNVIGTALATNPGLLREHLIMVAVLAVPLHQQNDEPEMLLTPQLVPSPPPGDPDICGVINTTSSSTNSTTTENKEEDFFTEVEKKLSQYQRPENLRRSMSVGSFASIAEGGGVNTNESDDDGSWVMETNNAVTATTVSSNTHKGAGPAENSIIVPTLNLSETAREEEDTNIISSSTTASPTNVSSTMPIRKIKLHSDSEVPGEEAKNSTILTKDQYNEQNQQQAKSNKLGKNYNKSKASGGYRRKKKRTVLVPHSSEDINPLRPCGACNEWLKKIAESNPYFKVVTFTDKDCNGVYVTPCQE